MTHRTNNKHPYFGVPPARPPRQALAEPTLKGKRVILSMPSGFIYDMRAASEIYRDREGKHLVTIVTEEHYFRWMFTHERPCRQEFPGHLVWVE